ncbi:MAG: glycosyltransferase family 2 protein [Bacteroidaceae bacterium]|nr:glycosyltransferase family 2 protein [Bacteroidaceae bacterium]
MSLSILIPAYNYDCTQLVRALYEQAINLTIDFEIIVADDASTNAATERQNAEIGKMPHCQYIRLKENHGRAAIRNFLAEKAKYDNLMFMDCDGKVVYLHFLSAYMKAIEDHDVVCGGMMHPLDMVLKNNNLRYQYEVRSEKMLKADKLNADPKARFISFCFVIKKKVFDDVKFDESFTDYGYEDVLFGMQIKQKGYKIFFIDNPLQNEDIESNPVFVEKTEEALRTLKKHEALFGDNVRLLRTVHRLKQTGTSGIVNLFGKMLRGSFRKNLCGKSPSVGLFNWYKLFYYLSL